MTEIKSERVRERKKERERGRDRVSERVGEGGREWERVRVRKPLRTAKEPAPLLLQW